MLIAENKPAFDSSDYLYELKLDGCRCLAYVNEKETDFRNKRNKSLAASFPELSKIHEQANKRLILDGEIIVMNGGKPDFSALQPRTLMSSELKIKLASEKLPASFVAFDAVYAGNSLLTNRTLVERKEILSESFSESARGALSKTIENQGLALYAAAAARGLEGIVAKRKDSSYVFGKRTKNWIKCKAMLDEDFIAAGFWRKSKALASVILASFTSSGELAYRGHVVMGVSSVDLKALQSAKHASEDLYKGFPDFKSAVWLEPALVCTVQFMEYTKSGSMRQPVFKGLRYDKKPAECVSDMRIMQDSPQVPPKDR
jgi:DNA ligase D-like protein (predicted ligase)